MKTLWTFVFAVVWFQAITPSAPAATVTWDGGGGDFSWQNPLNWSGDALPGTFDNVVINVASNVTITSSVNVTNSSLQCSNNLALTGGRFKVVAGNSVVQGDLSVSGFPILIAEGASTFTVAGSVSANGASFEANAGATISLPNLKSYSTGFVCFTLSWTANGAGSVLNFPGLTNVTGNSCSGFSVQALNGGSVQLTNLTTVTDGNLAILADGTGSLVEMPVFVEAVSAVRAVTLEARNGGSVAVPQLKRGPTLAVTLNTSGTLPVAQMEWLGGITVNGLIVSFPALTNFDAGNFSVSGGAVVSVPNLQSFSKGPSCGFNAWNVTGSNSVLMLPALTNLIGGTCSGLNVFAGDGGNIILTNIVTVTDGLMTFTADGSNSLVNLSRLQNSPGTRTVAFEARNAGTMSVPLLSGGSNVTVALKSGGILPVAQMNPLVGITVDAMAVDFPTLTNFNTGNFNLSGGAVVSVPNLKNYSKGDSCGVSSWVISDSNSVLRLPALTNLTGGTCTLLAVQAFGGAKVILTNVISITEGIMSFLADGTNSVVNLTRLQQLPGPTRSVSFEARASGTVLVPLVEGGPTIGVTLRTGGIMAVAQMTQLAAITVEAMTVDFPALTNFNAGSLTVSGGGVVTVPNLKTYLKGSSCGVSTWSVTGSNSVLQMPALTNMTGGTCTYLIVQALSGGRIILTNVISISEGYASFLADGANSVVDLSRWKQSPGLSRTVALEARNAGTLIFPTFQGGETVTVVIKSGGMLDTAELKLLQSLTVSGTSLSLPGITNLFSGNLIVELGAVLSLPNLTNHNQGASCAPSAWTVDGTGSVLNLPGLMRLTGGTCLPLKIQALNSGQAVLSGLTHIPSGMVHITSSGSGSLVNLQSLSNFVTQTALSELNATNNGSILLNNEGLIFSGVSIRTLSGSGVPPAVYFTNASQTLLYGRPWHSYLVEKRNTIPPGNPWNFDQRVPLTNYFQNIGPLAVANTEFSVREFVADPFDLELTPVPVAGLVNVVLYAATNQSFTIQTVTNLVAPILWQTLATVDMTNTFRILPSQSLAEPERFFRTNPL